MCSLSLLPSPSKRRVVDATGNPTDTTLVLSTLAEFLTKLEATKTKTAKKYQIPIDDWQLITAYVAQLQKNHCHTTDLTDNVTALGLAITQLSSTITWTPLRISLNANHLWNPSIMQWQQCKHQPPKLLWP